MIVKRPVLVGRLVGWKIKHTPDACPMFALFLLQSWHDFSRLFIIGEQVLVGRHYRVRAKKNSHSQSDFSNHPPIGPCKIGDTIIPCNSRAHASRC